MNKSILSVISAVVMTFVVTMPLSAQIDKIIGRWVTIDDKAGIPVSIVEIYRAENGKYEGKVERLLVKGYEDMKCEECKGELHGKKVAGMVIIRDMVYSDGKLSGGSVLDPENGKTYYGKIWYDPKTGHLILRGSLDRRGILGRNQEWVKDKVLYDDK